MNTNLTNLTMKSHCRNKCIKKFTFNKAIDNFKPRIDLRYGRNTGDYNPPSLRRIYNFKDRNRKLSLKSYSRIKKRRSLSLEDLPIYITLKIVARYRKYGSGI